MGSDQGLTRLFYDGGCGLCRGAVRFVARRDRSGRIHFAPLEGETFRRVVPAASRHGLPDSLVVLTPEGDMLTGSNAMIGLLRRMGPPWRWLGAALAWIPGPLREMAYRLVARLRPAKDQACPMDGPAGDDRFEP
ncbi:MAG TPA: DUF393 domain-containing protein [Geothrix sp.]